MILLPRDYLLRWLRNAYAMESRALELCKRQAERIEHYPELKTRLERHVEETRYQIVKLDQCFHYLEETPSLAKNVIGWAMGNLHAAAAMSTDDEIIKDIVASYAFEQIEITHYRILIIAAEQAKELEVARLCTEILQQEEEMASWLERHLQPTVEQFLQGGANLESPGLIADVRI